MTSLGLSLRTGVSVGAPSAPQLQVLTLSNSQFPELSVAGTVVGTIQNRTPGTALYVDPQDDRFTILDGDVVVGSTSSGYGDYPITITEVDGAAGHISSFVINAVSPLTFDSTRTKADSTRTFGGIEVRATLIGWNSMLAVLAEQRGM